MRFTFALFFCTCGVLTLSSFVSTAHAQFQPAVFTQTTAITTEPRYPEPHETFTASIGTMGRNLSGAAIAWYVDGNEQTSCKNARTCSVTAGGPGTNMNISALFTTSDEQTQKIEYTVTPTRVDLIIEADTTAPAFYKGRTLPSSDSTIRAVAVPFTETPPSSLTYTWELNDRTLFGGTLRGKDVTTFQIPFGDQGDLTVAVGDDRGRIFAEKRVVIKTVEPLIRFYEDNPLRGLSRIALPARYQLIGDEVTVRAETYFMDGEIEDTRKEIEWKINRKEVENPSTDPQVITLRSGGGTGSFVVEFFIRNQDKLLQSAKDAFTVLF